MAPLTGKRIDVEDSASASKDAEKSTPPPQGSQSQGKGKGKKNKGSSSSRSGQSASTTTKQTPGFAEGNNVLQSYGLSISGYRERVLSPFRADKFFHFVEQSYRRLAELKPGLPNRFTYEEFRHASALQLYHRLEAVKFDALGVKPAAPVRIPLPKSLRVFQPIWSVLANIGTVDDDDLRVQYIPDSILPDSDNLDSPHDVEGLLDCTLYDWVSSWDAVKKSRERKPKWQVRDALDDDQNSNEAPTPTKKELIEMISSKRAARLNAQKAIDCGRAKIIDGSLFYYPKWEPTKDRASPPSGAVSAGGTTYDTSVSDATLKKGTKYLTPADYDVQIEKLFKDARREKAKRIKPKYDVSYSAESYRISDGTIETEPGAYGARLHWDPQLWLDYENFVNEVSDVAMFSLSMPVETTGTYAWILPVEKREDDDSNVYARMPKASIPTSTWVLALLLQSSTLPEARRSTWYTETDTLGNVMGLRQRYINAAVRAPSPVEQYGTY